MSSIKRSITKKSIFAIILWNYYPEKLKILWIDLKKKKTNTSIEKLAYGQNGHFLEEKNKWEFQNSITMKYHFIISLQKL